MPGSNGAPSKERSAQSEDAAVSVPGGLSGADQSVCLASIGSVAEFSVGYQALTGEGLLEVPLMEQNLERNQDKPANARAPLAQRSLPAG